MQKPGDSPDTQRPGTDPPTTGPLQFDRAVATNGYAWWYVDALSDDGQHGLTIIIMIGSVFSPYYARQRRRGNGHPENHSAINVALYGRGGKRWALTERDANAVERRADRLAIGPSHVTWNGRWLDIAIDEVTVPVPRRLRGNIRVHPTVINPLDFELDRTTGHVWWPIAPRSRVEVDMRSPALRWRGDGYLDANWGPEPLEARFERWDWSRGMLADGRCAVLYNRTERSHDSESLALLFDPLGNVETFDAPGNQRLPDTPIWRIPRGTQAEEGFRPTVDKTLEDTPFYARSIINTRLLGEPLTAIHESLSLDRFDSRWVQTLLPFRMPRVRSRGSRAASD
ncbi:MAG: carotenoid 1,2-hydratase [Chromatiaceae bacterium]|jgi:carotenoid 1,2-hydratase